MSPVALRIRPTSRAKACARESVKKKIEHTTSFFLPTSYILLETTLSSPPCFPPYTLNFPPYTLNSLPPLFFLFVDDTGVCRNSQEANCKLAASNDTRFPPSAGIKAINHVSSWRGMCVYVVSFGGEGE